MKKFVFFREIDREFGIDEVRLAGFGDESRAGSLAWSIRQDFGRKTPIVIIDQRDMAAAEAALCAA